MRHSIVLAILFLTSTVAAQEAKPHSVGPFAGVRSTVEARGSCQDVGDSLGCSNLVFFQAELGASWRLEERFELGFAGAFGPSTESGHSLLGLGATFRFLPLADDVELFLGLGGGPWVVWEHATATDAGVTSTGAALTAEAGVRLPLARQLTLELVPQFSVVWFPELSSQEQVVGRNRGTMPFAGLSIRLSFWLST